MVQNILSSDAFSILLDILAEKIQISFLEELHRIDAVVFFLFTRTVDGHGAVQTLEVKLISFAVWGIFYLGVLAIEWLICFIARRFKH